MRLITWLVWAEIMVVQLGMSKSTGGPICNRAGPCRGVVLTATHSVPQQTPGLPDIDNQWVIAVLCILKMYFKLLLDLVHLPDPAGGCRVHRSSKYGWIETGMDPKFIALRCPRLVPYWNL